MSLSLVIWELVWSRILGYNQGSSILWAEISESQRPGYYTTLTFPRSMTHGSQRLPACRLRGKLIVQPAALCLIERGLDLRSPIIIVSCNQPASSRPTRPDPTHLPSKIFGRPPIRIPQAPNINLAHLVLPHHPQRRSLLKHLGRELLQI